MSRRTTTEIIAAGDYLKPDFNPSTLTVRQLLGLLTYHDVKYPSPPVKSELIDVFNAEIKPKVKKLNRERIKRDNSQASDDGITDGVTGRPLNNREKTVRRSRRLSRTPAPEEEPEPVAVVPPKRRRASAEPSLGGPSRRKTVRNPQPTLIEESEPEEEPVVRKVGRPRKTIATAGTQARKVSNPIKEDPESGWEDNNVFQSGTESSPLRPSPVRPRSRKSSASGRPAIRSRKSLSAPPEMASSPSKDKGKGREGSVRPPVSAFEPQLPSSVRVRRELSVVPDMKEEEEPIFRPHPPPIPSLVDTMAQAGVDFDEPAADEEYAEDQSSEHQEDENVRAVAQRIADGGQLVKRDSELETTRGGWLMHLLTLVLLFSTSGLVYQYKSESAAIGFCDAGTNTNAILEGLRTRRAAIESCNLENRTTLYLTPSSDTTTSVPPPKPTGSVVPPGQDSSFLTTTPEACPPPPLIPYVQPDECTPCPKHATCSPSSITCDTGYVLRPHPLMMAFPLPVVQKEGGLHSFERPSLPFLESDFAHAVYGAVSYLDGLPLVGPVAVPPRCVEDSRRKRHIGAVGRAIESILANERGRRLCEGVGVGLPEGDEATEAQRWGLEVEKLRDQLREKTAPSMLSTLDNTFNEAIQQLLQWGGVFMGEDANGKRFLAHKTPSMSWQCAAKVKTRQLLTEWLRSIIATGIGILSIVYVRHRQGQKAIENKQVASLVAVALDSLRNQELAHHTDPVMNPRPYLSSLQLRDLVLQDVHDVSQRKRLWSRVERVVEANANVMTSSQEVDGGDEQRVWEWVGGAGKTLPPGTPGVQRLGFDGVGQSGRIVA